MQISMKNMNYRWRKVTLNYLKKFGKALTDSSFIYLDINLFKSIDKPSIAKGING